MGQKKKTPNRVKVVHNSGGGAMGEMEPADTEESLLVSALEVRLMSLCTYPPNRRIP